MHSSKQYVVVSLDHWSTRLPVKSAKLDDQTSMWVSVNVPMNAEGESFQKTCRDEERQSENKSLLKCCLHPYFPQHIKTKKLSQQKCCAKKGYLQLCVCLGVQNIRRFCNWWQFTHIFWTQVRFLHQFLWAAASCLLNINLHCRHQGQWNPTQKDKNMVGMQNLHEWILGVKCIQAVLYDYNIAYADIVITIVIWKIMQLHHSLNI